MKLRISIISLVAAVAACASAPKLTYHTIDLSPSGGLEPEVNLVVGTFVVPDRLDRSQIVIQHSPTLVEYYATNRWAGSISEMIERKLTAEFGPADNRRPTLQVSGTVAAFEQVDSDDGPIGRVRLEVEIRGEGDKSFEPPLLARTYESVRRADRNSVDAVVRALSRALEDVAAEIAGDAAALGA